MRGKTVLHPASFPSADLRPRVQLVIREFGHELFLTVEVSIMLTKSAIFLVIPVVACALSSAGGKHANLKALRVAQSIYTVNYISTEIGMTGLMEKKSTDSWGKSGGTWQTLHDRHFAGIKFQVTQVTGTTTTSNPNIDHFEEIAGAWVEDGSELVYPSGASMGNTTAGGSTNVGGYTVSNGQVFCIGTGSTGPISSGKHIAYWKSLKVKTFYKDATPPSTGTDTWGRVEYLLAKLACTDASVTTRRTYGQPNREGELPADPNAPLRSVNYGPWDFKGGIFVGNMGSGKDMSGTSRTDLFVAGGSTYDQDYTLAALSVFDKGKPSLSGLSGSLGDGVGVYIPTSTGSLTESTVDWDHQLSINPLAYSSTSTTYNENPFSYVNVTDGNSDDYCIFDLPTSTSAHPNNSLFALALAIVDEANFISAHSSSNYWHYFSSKQYERGAKTTVTSGTSSATQTVGSTAGMQTGDSLYFETSNAYRTVSSVTNSTTVVLTATISTTTSENVFQGSFPRNDCAPRVWLIQEVH